MERGERKQIFYNDTDRSDFIDRLAVLSEYPDIPAFSRLASRAPHRPKLLTHFFLANGLNPNYGVKKDKPIGGHIENEKGLFFDVGGTVFEWKNAAREKIQKLADCARKDLPEVFELCPDPLPLKYECSI